MGLLGILFKVVAAVLLVVVGLGAFLYFTDYAAQATVTDRSADCSRSSPGEVEVTPKILPSVQHRVTLPDCNVWQVVCVGYDVDYHLQTKRTIVRDGEQVIYDSGTGATDLVGLARCGASNSGGGLI